MFKKVFLVSLIIGTASTAYAADIATSNSAIAGVTTNTAIDISEQQYPLALKQLKILGAPASAQIDTSALIKSFGAQLLNKDQLQQLVQNVQQAYAAQGVKLTHISVPAQTNDGIITLQLSVGANTSFQTFSSAPPSLTDTPALFVVPSRSTNNLVTPGSPVVKEAGYPARNKAIAESTGWKNTPAPQNNFVISAQNYPLKVTTLQLMNVPPSVSPIDTQALIAGYKGQINDKAGLTRLADAVRRAYLAQGIALVNVTIPKQNDNGTLVMQLSFGRVVDTELRGDTGKTTSWMKYYLDQMKAIYPLKRAPTERLTMQMDQLPGIDIDAFVEPQTANDGTIEGIKTITVSRYSPISGYVSLANGASDYLGPYQLQAGINWNQPTGPDVFGIDAMKSLPIANQLTYYDLKYDRYLTKDQLNLGLFYSHVETRPGGIYSSYDIDGVGDTERVSLTQPWILTRDVRFSNSLFITRSMANSVYNSLNLESYDDWYTAVGFRTSLGFKQGYSWNQFNLVFTEGQPWLGAPPDPANPSTPGAKARFFKTQADFTRTQYLTTNVSVIAGVVGQYTHDNLFSSQQLNYGNTLYGRAYTSSGLSGDNGYLARLQGNYNLRGLTDSLNGISPYVFYDLGELYDNASAEAPSERYSASSAGLGVSSILAKNWYIDTYMAKPLTHDVDANVERSMRYIFSVVGTF